MDKYSVDTELMKLTVESNGRRIIVTKLDNPEERLFAWSITKWPDHKKAFKYTGPVEQLMLDNKLDELVLDIINSIWKDTEQQ